MVDRRNTRSRLRPIALLAVALAALVGGAVAHAPREAQAQRSSSSGRGFLGVSLQDLTPSLRDSYDYQGNGVLVSDVVAGSPAAKLGIREGDILLRIEDDAVSNADQVTEKIRALRPGTLVGITVVRDGDTNYLGRAEIADLSTARDLDDLRAPAAPRASRAPRVPRTPRVAPVPAPDVRTFTMVGRGRLGVETHDLDADLAKYFKTSADGGVLVLRVVGDTPAAKAGLKAGDVITTVGGKAVGDSDALRAELRERGAGDVELRVLREGAPRTVTARLEEAPRWNWEHGGDGKGWMSWMDDDVPGMTRMFRFHGLDEDDKARIKAKLKDGKWNDGRVRVYRDFDDWDGMDPEDREEFEREMKELREEMRDLMRDLRDLRDDARDDD